MFDPLKQCAALRARLWVKLSAIALAVVFLSADGCDPLAARSAADRIGHAIDKIVEQSSQWQVTLQKLEEDLIKEGQETIATEVTQLMQRGIATTGAEMRCDADFIGQRMQEGLQRIRDVLLNRPPQPLRQYFCGVSPTSIKLALTAGRRAELDFFGYNLDAGRATVHVTETNGNQRVIENPQSIVATPTHYLMTVNLSSNGLSLGAGDQQVVFVLNPGLPSEETHTVNVLAPPAPAKFSIDAGTAYAATGGGAPVGAPFRRNCPTGAVGVGVRGSGDDLINQLQLVCAPLTDDGSLGGSLGGASSVAADGGPGGAAFDLACPARHALIGFTGQSSGNLERVGLQCSTPPNIVAQSGAVTKVDPNQGGGGGTPFSTACRQQFAVTGLLIRTDTHLITRMDFLCSKLQLQ
jgi:hypothetical protein